WLLFFLLVYETKFTQYRPYWLNFNSDNNPARGGISKIMLTQLIELSRTRYFATQLSLAVFAHNRTARRCYEALGFNVMSRETGTRSYDGVVWDLLRMEKQL
ncbi:GNAT family N-acetyltransferase, partial [Vibrio sp. McD22-P3]|uniref:GNAT family N-acetyltransferase n=1 Tax=Vibrio sp. McD22-P3 TaxID=2724880 RepID=UPI0029D98362